MAEALQVPKKPQWGGLGLARAEGVVQDRQSKVRSSSRCRESCVQGAVRCGHEGAQDRRGLLRCCRWQARVAGAVPSSSSTKVVTRSRRLRSQQSQMRKCSQTASQLLYQSQRDSGANFGEGPGTKKFAAAAKQWSKLPEAGRQVFHKRLSNVQDQVCEAQECLHRKVAGGAARSECVSAWMLTLSRPYHVSHCSSFAYHRCCFLLVVIAVVGSIPTNLISP